MRKDGAPTLNDVAASAGVSKVTASIVLTGARGNTRVSDATRQRILEAAERLQYRPNAVARSLRNSETHTIGFYMGRFIDTRDLFLSEILSGLQQGCEQNRHDFLMHGTFRGESADDIYAELLNGKVDGLVLHIPGEDPLVARLAASHLGVVAVANPMPGLASVTADDFGGARLQAEHLARQGHTRIVYATSPFPLASPIRRYQAFQSLAPELGMQVTAQTARLGDFEGGSVWNFAEWASEERPTAVVCWHDNFAYRLIARLGEHGLRVPDDVAVIGFDGATSPIPPAYRLTTIRAPWRQVAATAVSLLVANRGKPPPVETVLPVEFVPGETG